MVVYKIQNGLALNATLHRAFDIGLLSLDDNYNVLIRPKLSEEKSPYEIHQFEGQRIILPENPSLYPDPEKLQWHRRKHDFKHKY